MLRCSQSNFSWVTSRICVHGSAKAFRGLNQHRKKISLLNICPRTRTTAAAAVTFCTKAVHKFSTCLPMLRHHIVARKTSNTRSSAFRNRGGRGGCFDFLNVRLIACGGTANHYAVALLELTLAISWPAQIAASALEDASNKYVF